MTTVALERARTPTLARWRSLIAWWALSRLVTLGAFLVLDALGRHGRLAASMYKTPLALLGAWDGVWYERVSQHGYLLIPGQQSNPAFFPLFPILMRELNLAFGISYTAAGAVISNLSLLVAVIALFELSCLVIGDRERSRHAASLLAISPMAFVFSMAYPESFALACTALALLAGMKQRWLPAAVLAALAVLARPEGVVLVVPLAAIAWEQRDRLDPAGRGRALAAVLAAPAAIISYPLYLLYALHNANAWGEAQERWGRAFNPLGPWRAITGLHGIVTGQPVIGRDAPFVVVYALLLWAAARQGVGRPWILGGALVLVLPIFSGSFVSEARFGLLALPVYWGAASLMRGPRSQRAIELVCLVGLVGFVLALPWLWP